MAFAFVLSGGSFASGVYIRQQENLSLVYMEPDAIMMSEQQSAELSIQKIKPNKDVVAIDTNDIKWSMGNNDIARIDGNRIVGLNIGTTEVVGKYRNKIITLNVDVVEKIDGMVDISLCYKGDNLVSKFAGSGVREHIDDNLAYSSFVSPESIAKQQMGLYIFLMLV